MRDPIQHYIQEVIEYADLARDDERAARGELNEHLQSLFTGKLPPDTKEAYAMIENEFGKASLIGRGIARAKGRIRTYWKKQRRRLPITIPVVLVLVFMVRWAVAQTFYAAGTGGEPLIPQGSHVVVYKLARTFLPGDVVVFRMPDAYWMGIVKSQAANGLVVSKHGQPDMLVPLDKIVGRVFLNTR
jgi:hypothetical protein